MLWALVGLAFAAAVAATCRVLRWWATTKPIPFDGPWTK